MLNTHTQVLLEIKKVFNYLMSNSDFLKLNVLFFIFLFSLILSGCSFPKRGDGKLSEMPYMEKGIVLDISATLDLNMFNEQPHTLVLVLYQLADPNAFNQMLGNFATLEQMLEGNDFDRSVLTWQRRVIQPGEKQKFTLDRAAGVRYLGIVTGYFSQSVVAISRLVAVEGAQKNKRFFWTKTVPQTVETRVQLVLGRSGIEL